MKEKLTNNIRLKLSSLLAAFLIWLVVTNVYNPINTKQISVNLEVENESILTDANKTYSIDTGRSVNIVYNVRALDADKVKSSDFRAYIDLSQLYDITSSAEVRVEYNGNADVITELHAKPSTVKIKTEEIQEKNFLLTYSYKGEPAEHYYVNELQLEPVDITIRGPVSEVGKISSVGVLIDTGNLSEDSRGSVYPTLYDANGNVASVDRERISLEPEEVNYYLKMLKGKSLGLNINISGEVAVGYQYTGFEVNMKSVSVLGPRSVLDKLNSIDIPASALSIGGLSTNKTVSLDINNYLQEGLSVNGDSELVVTLKVEKTSKKLIQLAEADISISGVSENYDYDISPEKITVTVSGLESDLNKLSPSALSPSMDFGELKPGKNVGKIYFSPPEGLRVDSYSPFEISVSSGDEEESSEATEEESQSNSEEAESSAGESIIVSSELLSSDSE